MGECKLDHSMHDVKTKLEQQAPYLSPSLLKDVQRFLMSDVTQHNLNEVFHLLKKFDLSSKEEQSERSNRMQQLINSDNVPKG
ncbi:hypothetical protein ACERII_06620 [Evansella sp. AB-rgal1]|uniref:hypothetical protein n=1 Tax=Evansella sp. AB-rgal1 TaxID=3242696 RepID=UPI00359D387A